jgi:hypothetical protein
MNCPVAELLQLPLFTVAAKPCNTNVENEFKSDGAERSCFLFVTLLMYFIQKAPNRCIDDVIAADFALHS